MRCLTRPDPLSSETASPNTSLPTRRSPRPAIRRRHSMFRPRRLRLATSVSRFVDATLAIGGACQPIGPDDREQHVARVNRTLYDIGELPAGVDAADVEEDVIVTEPHPKGVVQASRVAGGVFPPVADEDLHRVRILSRCFDDACRLRRPQLADGCIGARGTGSRGSSSRKVVRVPSAASVSDPLWARAMRRADCSSTRTVSPSGSGHDVVNAVRTNESGNTTLRSLSASDTVSAGLPVAMNVTSRL